MTVRVLLATWALAKKGWLTRRREGLFYRSVVILSFASILPTLLSTRALAGPLEAQAARFADLGGTDNYLAFTTIGIVGAAWVGMVTNQLAFTLGYERMVGTLGATWMSSMPRVLLIAGHATGHALANSLLTLGMFAAGWLLYRFPLTLEVLGLIAVAGASYVASVALALFVGGVVIRFRAAGQVVLPFTVLSTILAGVAYPVAVFPEWLQIVAHLLPLTWILRGVRATLVYADPGDALLSAGVLALMGAIYGLATTWLFGVFERSARRQGILEAF